MSQKLLPAPAFGDDAVYAVSETGVYAVGLSDGHTIWHNQVATPKFDYLSPVVADNLVLMGYDDTLYAFDTSDGKQRWTGQLKSKEGAQFFSASVPENGTVYTLFGRGIPHRLGHHERRAALEYPDDQR